MQTACQRFPELIQFMMKLLWTNPLKGTLLAMLLIAVLSSSSLAMDIEKDALITSRLNSMSDLIRSDFTKKAKGYIKGYLFHKDDTRDLLGKTALYFPIFEFYLRSYHLPEELKYLPVIESRLRPYAYSHAGAGGIWQFTTPTAKECGLQVNRYLDERRDPYKSTRAALRYLAYLHDQFQDWEFVLAAYNCGEGRVRQAMARANSEVFTKVLPFLPTETQQYIPRFLAGQYICRYHLEHELYPTYAASDLRFTRTVVVYKDYSMFTLSKVTGVALQTLKILNPAYYDNYIVASNSGNFLTVPQRSFVLLMDYVSRREGWKPFEQMKRNGYVATTWIVQPEDTLDKLAMLCGATRIQIMDWNNLRHRELYPGQILKLYYVAPMTGEKPKA